MLNKVTIIGNLGHEPKITNTQNGNICATLNVAVTERGYKLANGTQIPEHTEWFNVVIWGKLATVAQNYLHKGSKVYIEGKLRTREYTAKDGSKKKTTEVLTDSLIMLSPKSEQTNHQTNTSYQQPIPQYMQNAVDVAQNLFKKDEGEDLPF